MVTINENASWHYKHWGCVTANVIGNVKSFLENDVTMLDGFEELPDDDKAKVERAFQQGHVDDEDWKGDVEMNRPGQNGFRLTKAAKKKIDSDQYDSNAGETGETGEKRQKKKKGSRPNGANVKKEKRSEMQDGSEEEGDKEEEEKPIPSTRTKGKKRARANGEGQAEDRDDKQQAPAPEASRSKKARGTKADIDKARQEDGDATIDQPAAVPNIRKTRTKKIAVRDEPAQAPKQRKSRTKATAAAAENDADGEEAEEGPKANRAAPRNRGKRSKT